MSSNDPQPTSDWPHRMAVMLVCATFPLIWIGGLVTTYDAGMAVPDWPSTYGYNLFLYPWQAWLAGPWDLLIEHGHRLLASLVGLIAIAAVCVTWRCESRRWVRYVSLGALALVIAQGLLGGLRVLMDARQIAQIHGIVGPTFFAYSVSFAAVTSNWWRDNWSSETRIPRNVMIAAWPVAGMAFFQLVCGSQLRHVTGVTSLALFGWAVKLHIAFACLLLLASPFLAVTIFRNKSATHRLGRMAVLLASLIAVQILMGIGTWFSKYGIPAILTSIIPPSTMTVQAEGMTGSLLATAHVANGALILATSIWIAIRSSRFAAARTPRVTHGAVTGAPA